MQTQQNRQDTVEIKLNFLSVELSMDPISTMLYNRVTEYDNLIKYWSLVILPEHYPYGSGKMSNSDGLWTSSISLKSIVQAHIALVASFLCKLSQNCSFAIADNKLISLMYTLNAKI